MKFHKKAAISLLAALTSVNSVTLTLPPAVFAAEEGSSLNWLTPSSVSWPTTVWSNRTAEGAFDHQLTHSDGDFHSSGNGLNKELRADFDTVHYLHSIEYHPRSDHGNGTMTAGKVGWSIDGTHWTEQTVSWSWTSGQGDEFKTVAVNDYARYIRFIPTAAGGDYFSAREIKVFEDASAPAAVELEGGSVTNGRQLRLPETVDIDGSAEQVSWHNPVLTNDDLFGTVPVKGTTESGRTVITSVRYFPENLEYLIEPGLSEATPSYQAASTVSSLKNEVSSKIFSEGDTWGFDGVLSAAGVTGPDFGYHIEDNADPANPYLSGYWGAGDVSAPKPIKLKLTLTAGDYIAHLGTGGTWWGGIQNRPGELILADAADSETNLGEFSTKAGANEAKPYLFTVPEDGVYTLIIRKPSGDTTSQNPVVSWYAISRLSEDPLILDEDTEAFVRKAEELRDSRNSLTDAYRTQLTEAIAQVRLPHEIGFAQRFDALKRLLNYPEYLEDDAIARNTIVIDKANSTAEEPTGESGGNQGHFEHLIDGNTSTYYHSKYSAPAAPFPHQLTFDLGKKYDLDAVSFLPRQASGNRNGDILVAEVLAGDSMDNLTSYGTWSFLQAANGRLLLDYTKWHGMSFMARDVQYVQLKVKSTGGTSDSNKNKFTSAAEMKFYRVEGDKTDLRTKLNELNDLALVESKYTSDSWQAYSEKLTAAQTVDADTDATQSMVDQALTELNEACEALVRQYTLTFKQGDTVLHTVVLTENSTTEDLQNAVNTAKEALTIEDGYVFVRWSEEPAFPTEDKEYTAVVLPNTEGLQAKIEEYEAIENPDSIYTPSTWSAYTAAVEAGRELLNGESITSEQLTQALAAIDAAKAALAVTITFVDGENSTTKDFVVKSSANDVKNGAPQTNAPAGYVFEKWTPDVEAPTAPKTYTAKYVLDYSAIENVIEACDALSSDDYTETSWNALQDLIAAAQTAMTDGTYITPEAVAAAAQAMSQAKNTLVRVYTITFLNTDGSTAKTVKLAAGTSAEDVLAQAPTLSLEAGYRLDKWVTSDEAESDVAEVTEAAAYKPVLAVDKSVLQEKVDEINGEIEANSWTIDKYTDDSWNALREKLTAAQTVLSNDAASASDVVNALSDLNTARTSLTRAWVLTFSGEGMETVTVKVAEGSNANNHKPADPTREGYVFDGWSPALSTNVTAAATYTAQWSAASTAALEPYRYCYYPFNGNTDDHWGSRNGTADATGVTYSNDGKSGQGVHIDANSKIAFEQSLPNMDNYTLSYWAKADVLSGQSWITQGTDKTGITALRIGNSNAPGYVIDGSSSGMQNGQYYSIGDALNASTWYHITYVKTPNSLAMYRDGVYIRTLTGVNLKPGLDVIGGSDFQGYVDEVRVYNKALTASEVLLDYQEDQKSHPYTYTVTFKTDLGSGASSYKEYAMDTAGDAIADEAEKFVNDNSFTAEDGYLLVWTDDAGETVTEFDAVSANKTYTLKKIVDLSALQDAVDAISNQSLVKENYTPDSWTALEDALRAALAGLENPPETAVEVAALVTALNNAVDGLIRTYTITLIYSENGTEQTVSMKISAGATAEQVLAAAPVITPADGYVFIGWAAEDGSPVTTVNGDATYHAVVKVDKSALAAKLGEIRRELGDLGSDDFTADSWTAIQTALRVGDLVIENSDASVEETAQALEQATSAWEGRVRVYTVTFIVGGDTVETVKIAANQTLSEVVPELTKDGHDLDAWYSSKEFTEKADTDTAVSAATTLYGRWQVQQKTVTLHFGNDAADETKTINYGSSLADVADPEWAGHDFLGWFTDEACTESSKWTMTTPVTGNMDLYASWELQDRSATLHFGNGNENETVTVKYGSALNIESDPTWTGHTFQGWYTDDALGEENKWTNGSALTENLNLYAKWQLNRQTVTLHNTNGTNNTETAEVDYGTEYSPADPTFEGHVFAGWYTDEACTEANKWTAGTAVEADLDLYAKWTIKQITVTLDLDGGNGDSRATVDWNSKLNVTAPSKAGFKFAGWLTVGEDGSETPFDAETAIQSELTLKARWTAVVVTVEGVDGVITLEVAEGKAVKPATDPEKGHYSFKGWYADEAFANVFNFDEVLHDDVTVYAKWQADVYTCTFNTDGAGEISSQSVSYDGTTGFTTPTPPTKDHYTFAGWYSDAEKTQTYTFTGPAESNVTLYAKWTPVKYTVTLQANNGTEATTAQADYGKAYMPEQPEREGFHFVGWFTTEAFAEDSKWTAESKISGNVTLYAKWTKDVYTITLDLDGGQGTQSVQIPHGEKLAVDAPAKAGYIFKGWAKVDADGNETAFDTNTAIIEALNLKAKWEKITVTVHNVDGLTSLEIQEGKAVKPEDPTKNHYAFAGWYADTDFNTPFEFNSVLTDHAIVYARWTANTYTARFEPNGGSQVGNVSVTYDGATAFGKPADPSKAHYMFEGWYTDATLKNKYNFSTPAEADITLYAKWTADEYTVSFNTNGGSTVDAQTITYDGEAKIAKPSDPTKAHYTFGGWYTDAEFTNAYDFNAPVEDDLILYAKWNADTYTVRFETNGGSLIKDQTIEYNGTTGTEKPSDPTKEHYSFGGWYADAELKNEYDFSAALSADATVYAKWNANSYTATFMDGDQKLDEKTVTYSADAVFTAPAAPTKDHYSFAGWYTEAELTNEYDFATKVTASLTLYAKWTVDQHQIVIHANNGTKDVTKTADWNSTFTLDDPVKEGHTFEGWYTNEDLSGDAWTSGSTITGDLELYAKWSKKSYDVTLDLDGGTGTESVKIAYGDKLTVADPVKPGYIFTGWVSVDDEGNETAFDKASDTIKAATTLKATWKQIVVTVEGVDGLMTLPVEDGKAVKPADPKKEHHAFGGWYADADFNTEFNFDSVLSKDATVYAKWMANTYTVTFDTNGGGAVAEQTIVYDGKTGTGTPANPTRAHYDFAGWYADAELKNEYDFSAAVSADVTVYAKWNPKTYTVLFMDGETRLDEKSVVYSADAVFEALEAPTKDHYTFDAWYTDAAFENAYSFDTKVTGDLTLYAKWTPDTHTITINTNDGQDPTTQNAACGSAFTLDNPTRTGYTFGGWFTDEKCTNAWTSGSNITGDLHLYAKWTAEQRNVTLHFNNGDSMTINKVDYDSTYMPDTPTRTGYTFGGWFTTIDFAEGSAWTSGTKVTEDVTLYAKWTQNTYTITLDLDGGQGAGSIEVGYDEKLTVADPTKDGYLFTGWVKVDGEGNETAFDKDNDRITGEMTLKASWKQIIVSVNGVEGLETLTIEDGKAVRPENPTKNHYQFAGWYADEACSDEFDFDATVIGDTSIYAKWTANTYKAQFSTGGGSEIAEVSTVYDGTSGFIRPDDPRREGYTFKGWFSDAELKNAYDFSTPAAGNITLYAQWEKDLDYTLLDQAINKATQINGRIDQFGSSEEVKKTFTDALESGEQIRADAKTQTEIDQAASVLNQALLALRLSPEVSRLADLSTN